MAPSKQERAIRAKESALEKMAKQDFAGAKKLAQRARKLDPDLPDISQIILVCEVHSPSGRKRERDWYKLLGLDPNSDGASVKERCNKMVLDLQHDKNALPGAAEAFLLVCQAKAVLTAKNARNKPAGSDGHNLGVAKAKSQDLSSASGPGPSFNAGGGNGKTVQDAGGGNGKTVQDGRDGRLQDSGFAGFRSRSGPGPFGQGVLNNTEYGGDGRLQDSGFAGFRSGPGPFGQGVLSNTEHGNLQKSGFAAFQTNIEHGNLQKSGFAAFQTGPNPFNLCSLSSVKGAVNAKTQDTGFDHSSLDNLIDKMRNAKVQDSGFSLFGHGVSSNSKDVAGNAKAQDSGFGNGPGPFNHGSLSGGAGNANQQDSGFAAFDQRVSNNVKDGSANVRVPGSSFTNFQNRPGMFGQGVSSKSKDGGRNAKVQDSGFGNGPGPIDHGSLSHYRAGNANEHDAAFRNGGKRVSDNIEDGIANVRVPGLSFGNFQKGPGMSDHDSVNNSKGQDSGSARFPYELDLFGKGALINTDGDGNAKSQDFEKAEPKKNAKSLDLEKAEPEENAKSLDLENAEPEDNAKSLDLENAEPEDNAKSLDLENAEPEDNAKSQDLEKAEPEENAKSQDFEKADVPQPKENAIKHGEIVLEYSDSELNDFEKSREKDCFSPGQIWAVYDTLDAMPRFYARINNIINVSSDGSFEVEVTWLEPCPDNETEKKWLLKGLPASCGRFKVGESENINDLAIFSHLASSKKGVRCSTFYRVYPRKGETWAIFKNCEMDEFDFELEFVEIMSDYCVESGVSVGFLGKIKGFSTLFSRANVEVKIEAKDKLRFSHRVSSFQMTGPDGGSGFFELDPASLPASLPADLNDSTFSPLSDIFN